MKSVRDPALRVLRRGVVTGGLAGAAAGALDALWAWRSAAQFLPGVLARMRFVLFNAAEYALAGAGAGLALALVLLVLSRGSRLGDVARFAWKTHADTRARDPREALVGLSLALVALPVVGLSLAIELWVALVLRRPLLPNFVDLPEGKIDPHLYWVRGNLFDDGRIQGVVGNAHSLAMMCLFALIVFAVLYATQVRRRTMLIFWSAIAAVLLVKAASATVYLSIAVVVAVLIAVLLMRAASPRRRARLYLLFAAVAVVGIGGAVLLRDQLLSALGKGSDLTGRIEIWQAVWERAITRPVFGNGFSSPWVPWDPAFDGWILNHGLSVFHAHDMWLDVFLQLGAVGVALMAVAWLALAWRAWFFAVDRPRWDLDARRPYSPLALLPVLFTAVLLVEGLAESAPIMLWGWLLLILLSFKMKAVPLIGVGVGERTPVISHGPQPRQVP